MATLTPKPATELSLDELANLMMAINNRSLSGNVQHDAESFKIWAAENDVSLKHSYAFYLPEHPTKPMGGVFIGNQASQPKASKLVAFGVVPCFRGKGHGENAITQVIRAEKARGIDQIDVTTDTVNVPAVKRFEAAGFTAVGSAEDGRVRLILRL